MKPALEELPLAPSETDSPVPEALVQQEAEASEGGQAMEHMCINLGFRMLSFLMLQGDAVSRTLRPATTWAFE